MLKNFYFVYWEGGGARIFFHFSLVPNMFPLSYQWVPQHVLHSKCCPPFTYIGGRKGRNIIVQNRREPPQFFVFLFLSDGPIKLARFKKEKEKKIGNLFTISIIEWTQKVCTKVESNFQIPISDLFASQRILDHHGHLCP